MLVGRSTNDNGIYIGVFQKRGPVEEVKTARLVAYLGVTTLVLTLLLVMTVAG